MSILRLRVLVGGGSPIANDAVGRAFNIVYGEGYPSAAAPVATNFPFSLPPPTPEQSMLTTTTNDSPLAQPDAANLRGSTAARAAMNDPQEPFQAGAMIATHDGNYTRSERINTRALADRLAADIDRGILEVFNVNTVLAMTSAAVRALVA